MFLPESESCVHIPVDGQHQHPGDSLPSFDIRSCTILTQLAENASEHLSRPYHPLLSDLVFLNILLVRKS